MFEQLKEKIRINKIKRMFRFGQIKLDGDKLTVEIPYELLEQSNRIELPLDDETYNLGIRKIEYVIDYKNQKFINPKFKRHDRFYARYLDKLTIKNAVMEDDLKDINIGNTGFYGYNEVDSSDIYDLVFENVNFKQNKEINLLTMHVEFKDCRINEDTVVNITTCHGLVEGSDFYSGKAKNIDNKVFIARDDEFLYKEEDGTISIEVKRDLTSDKLANYLKIYNIPTFPILNFYSNEYGLYRPFKGYFYEDEENNVKYFLNRKDKKTEINIYDKKDIRGGRDNLVRNEPQYIIEYDEEKDEILFKYTVHKYGSTGFIRTYNIPEEEIWTKKALLTQEEYIYYLNKFLTLLNSKKEQFKEIENLDKIILKIQESLNQEQKKSNNIEINVDDNKITINILKELKEQEKKQLLDVLYKTNSNLYDLFISKYNNKSIEQQTIEIYYEKQINEQECIKYSKTESNTNKSYIFNYTNESRTTKYQLIYNKENNTYIIIEYGYEDDLLIEKERYIINEEFFNKEDNNELIEILSKFLYTINNELDNTNDIYKQFIKNN